MAQSTIGWTEMTRNPTTGCNKISAGCKYCYAEVMTRRLEAMGIDKYKDGFKVRVHEDALNVPYSWKKPKVVFVNSMSDLFHPEVPFDFIEKVFKRERGDLKIYIGATLLIRLLFECNVINGMVPAH